MPKKAAFVMPSDEQIWEKVNLKLASFPDAVKKSRAFVGPEQLFEQTKQWYLELPNREAALAAKLKVESKQQLLADRAYLAERKRQGKPTYTQEELAAKYPSFERLRDEKFSVKALHDYADVISLLMPASDLCKDYKNFQAVSRKKLFEYLSRAYEIYLSISASSVHEETMRQIKEMLITQSLRSVVKNNLSDIHCFLALVFNDANSKTIHLYANTFKIAMAYDVEPLGFSAFIKDLGGLEKIRIAYATVHAADAGKLKPAYIKNAETVASIQSLNAVAGRSFQLGHGEGAAFRNDILDRFCLVLAHIDSLDQIELISQVPATPAIEKYLIDKIGNVAKANKNTAWVETRDSVAAKNLKKFLDNHEVKEQKAQAKEALRKKKEEALAKKSATDERRFSKQRANSQAAPKSTAKKATKIKA